MTRNMTRLNIHKLLILRLIAFSVLLNGLLIVGSTLASQLLMHNNNRDSSIIVSLPLLIGLTLVYLAILLRRRKRAAWMVVLPVYGFLLGLNSSQALLADREYTLLGFTRNLLVPALIVSGLIFYRQEFSVKSDIRSFAISLRVIALVLLLTFFYGIVGFTALDKHDFHKELTTSEAFHRTIDQFDFTSDRELVPYSRRAKLFSDSLNIMSAGALIYTMLSLFQPIRSKLSDQSEARRRVEELLRDYPANSEDYFKVWPHDKIYYFSKDGQAALAYHVRRGVALVAGDPCGQPASFFELLLTFREFCRTNDWLPSLIHVQIDQKKLYEKQGFNLQKIGEEAVLNLSKFMAEARQTKYFRQICNKFQKQGYSSELLLPPHSTAVMARLKAITIDWLRQPGRTERGFMMGYFSDEYMQQCAVMVLRDAAGTIQAFINQIRAYDSEEADYDLLRQTQEALGNSSDFLLLKFIDYLQASGFKRLNLGLCPLAGLDNDNNDRTVIDSMLQFVYANGDRFYSFSGLRRFKAKYQPEWRGRYIAYKGGVPGFTRTLNALNGSMKRPGRPFFRVGRLQGLLKR